MSRRRLLVMGAGTAAGENFIRSLRHDDPSLVLLGCHDDRFVLKQSGADARYLLPSPRARHFLRALRALVRAVGVDLVIPTSDVHVQRLSIGRRYLPGKTFLPAPAVVSLCRDTR